MLQTGDGFVTGQAPALSFRMSLRDHIQRIVDACPDGVSVTLPVETLRGWLGERVEPSTQMDYTLLQVAELFGRKVSTVREWCQAGRIPGAYKFMNREWRIPPTSVDAMQERERAGEEPAPVVRLSAGKPADLGAWRKVG